MHFRWPQCDAWDYYNGVCTPGTSANPSAAASDWQTFTDAQAGFSIQAPPAWSQETLPDQNEGAIHGMAVSGSEGGVEVYWGVGFGGACTTGTEPMQLAQGEVAGCHTINDDGTEDWSRSATR
jgi:hypothetical protein